MSITQAEHTMIATLVPIIEVKRIETILSIVDAQRRANRCWETDQADYEDVMNHIEQDSGPSYAFLLSLFA